ncbi:hypothetical protein BaRGS_00029089 [Batillaria attramentaria]|uniref:Uncharacterized protein n=1 Tax=Batillaria attramentaria TaxID=370345 RepID=A0ABD0JYU6_9CAEN
MASIRGFLCSWLQQLYACLLAEDLSQRHSEVMKFKTLAHGRYIILVPHKPCTYSTSLQDLTWTQTVAWSRSECRLIQYNSSPDFTLVPKSPPPPSSPHREEREEPPEAPNTTSHGPPPHHPPSVSCGLFPVAKNPFMFAVQKEANRVRLSEPVTLPFCYQATHFQASLMWSRGENRGQGSE